MNNQSVKAFTLVELILVILLFSIVAGLTIPNFSRSFARHALETSAKELTYVMRYAQSRAITSNEAVQMNLDIDNGQYWLMQEVSDTAGISRETEFGKMKGRMGRVFKIAKTLEMTTEAAFIKFFPDGSMDKREIKLCLKEDCFTISTQAQRGYVRVFRSEYNG